MVAVGITHTECSFPAAFSFCHAENTLSFEFFIQCLKDIIFIDDIPLPRVLVSDQAAALMTCLPVRLPGVISQLCEWHGAENIRK